jgi:hypothetical protein
VSGLQQVHIRVNEAATEKPTPCRVRFTDGQGHYFAPYGRLPEFALGQGVDVGGQVRLPSQHRDADLQGENWAYIDGTCEIALPPGLTHVAIAKGPEYLPLKQEVQLAAGKLALRFALERWSDLRQEGWFPGDTRAHYLSAHAAVLEGGAEDLAVVNVLAFAAAVQDFDSWGQNSVARAACPSILEFSGQQPALERDGCIVVVNTHNTHSHLGSLALLHCHRVVYPLSFGQVPGLDTCDNWTLADWCDQCHRKHGLVVWTNSALQPMGNHLGEALADMILGKVDAVEVECFQWRDQPHLWTFPWYPLLNAGFRVPLVGSSAKLSNTLQLGSVRTFARLQPGEALTYTRWIEAIRMGRTFASNGPLLLLTVNGQDPGAMLQVGGDQPLQVRAAVTCLTPVEYLELVANGRVVASQTPTGSPCSATIEKEIRLPQGGWLAARSWGKTWVQGPWLGQRIYAHTSPIDVRVDGKRALVDSAAVQTLREYLVNALSWVDHRGRFENDGQRLRLRKVFEDALRVLDARV